MAKVLIVDDEELVAKLYQKEFVLNGFEVEMASDGEDAMTKAANFQPDFILLDIMLPKVDGIQVFKKMQADINLKNIPVAFLSTLGEDISNFIAPEEKILISKATMFLQKDQFDPQQIVEKVKNYLKSQNI